VAAFVGVAAIATLAGAVLTSWGLERTLDHYVSERSENAARTAAAIAGEEYAAAGLRWTVAARDRLAHELVLTGYDFRLVRDGRVLLDTTKLESRGAPFRRAARVDIPVAGGGSAGTLELYALTAAGGTHADVELQSQLDQLHLVAAGVSALVAILCGLIVAGRLTRPLRRLALLARELAAGRSGPVPALRAGSPELRDLSQALATLATSLAQQSASRRQLAQDLAHELRTPLMLLQGRIEAMQDGVVPFAPEELDTLHEETVRLGRLVGQIERLAEAEAHRPRLAPRPVSLEQVARDVGETLAVAFELRGLRLELRLAPAPTVADPDAVRQIATNLVTNALKYAPPAVPVSLETAREDGWAVLRVRDGGTTLAGPEADRVFERFYRGPQAAAGGEGIGIGLHIARELARAQGGTVELEMDGAGTAFALRLPAAKAGPADPSALPVPGSWPGALHTPPS
jgi:two-component system sensor histidine kinase BaeS